MRGKNKIDEITQKRKDLGRKKKGSRTKKILGETAQKRGFRRRWRGEKR